MNDLFIERFFGSEPRLALMQALVVIFSICCHEYAHARVALWQGDPTAADEGHLTLNPLKQMGVFSLLMLAFMGIAWGQVPVSPDRMKHRYSDALVSFAGPAMNLLLFFCFTLLFAIGYRMSWPDGALVFFSLGAILNIVLFLINMVPAPGLDGWGVLKHFCPRLTTFKSEWSVGLTLLVLFGVFIAIKYFYAAGIFMMHLFGGIFITVLGTPPQ